MKNYLSIDNNFMGVTSAGSLREYLLRNDVSITLLLTPCTVDLFLSILYVELVTLQRHEIIEQIQHSVTR